jgi:hypothetical protein
MTSAGFNQNGFYGYSEQLAATDLSPDDRQATADLFAHAAGRVCKTCGRTIEARQAARRRGEADWAHDVCPD